MITQELLDYVNAQLSAGVAREQITSDLLAQGGWTGEQINEAFQVLQQSVPVQMPQQETGFEMTQKPRSIKYFEWLMYGSFFISFALGLIQLGSNIDLAIILSANISYLIRLAFVYLVVYKRISWPRIVLAVMLALGSFSVLIAILNVFSNLDITNLLIIVPLLLEIAAIYFVFTKDSSTWLAKTENKTVAVTDGNGNVVSVSVKPIPGKGVENMWDKAIPYTNWISGVVASALFLFSVFVFGGGLEVFDNNMLGEFAQLMLVTILGFWFFVLLENFVFRNLLKVHEGSALDLWIMMLIGARNGAVILSVIPFIQIFGLGALGLGGIPWLLIYIVLLVLRFRKPASLTAATIQ